MVSKLTAYLEELKQPVPEPPLEPDLDDVDEKIDTLLREQMDLHSGAVRKGITEPGEGTESPAEGCLVLFHLSVKKQDGSVLESTRLDEEGSGVPKAFVLGKGRRAPRGWELALEGMLLGERAMFQISPEYSYAQPGCQVQAPPGTAPDAALLLDIQLVRWYRAGVRALGSAGVIKRTVRESASWEKPSAPFEVVVALQARIPSSSGRQGEGTPYFQPREPLKWTLGAGSVGAHLEEGIAAMAKGERAFLSCPLDPGAPSGLIPQPPEAVERVEYEAELLRMVQVRDLTGTGQVTKRRLREGTGEFPIDCPLEDNAVRVHFKASLPASGKVVYDSRGASGSAPPLEFDTGVDAVPEAVDMCIRLMTPQELASVRSAPEFAYQGRSDRPAECPEDAEVEFEVELLSFDKTPNWQSMTAADKILRAEALRQQGNTTFKAGQLRFARQKYLKAIKLLDGAYDASDQEVEAMSAAKANCLANLALVCQKEGNFTECFSWCDKALRESPEHPKALYRRGTTHAILGNYAEAEEDLLHAKAADPANGAEIDRELARMHQRRKASATKERQEFRSFFDRTK